MKQTLSGLHVFINNETLKSLINKQYICISYAFLKTLKNTTPTNIKGQDVRLYTCNCGFDLNIKYSYKIIPLPVTHEIITIVYVPLLLSYKHKHVLNLIIQNTISY